MTEARTRTRGRPRGFDVEAALDRAVEVFWRRGYAAAGVAELTAAMGIAPPSLYAAFGDKRGLFLAALDRYAATAGAGPLEALRAARGEGRLEAFLLAVVDLSYDGERGRGCLAACVAGCAAGCDAAIRARLQALLGATEAALEATAGPGGPPGRVLLAAMHAIALRARAGAPRADAEALARDLAAAIGPPGLRGEFGPARRSSGPP